MMQDYQSILDEHFIDNLDYTFVGQALPKPELDGIDNIESYEISYEARGIRIIVVECHDRIIEFQKRLIKKEKKNYPNSHFLFVSNGGKVFDLYNDCTSKKLKKLTYDEIGRNTRLFKEKLELFDVTGAEDGTQLQINVERAFEVNDKVTKNFFDKFQKIHDRLKKSINGIEDDKDRSWYASVMMNRLMFIYFLQKHKVIQGDTDFLLNKFLEVKANGRDYYREFLLPLFFYGFARKDENPHKQAFVKEYGPIRYLNGGLFYPHHLEKKYQLPEAVAPTFGVSELQTTIRIDSKEIEKVLNFLNGYTWYLDSRPVKSDDEINPDVLGFIFEKYINQKELGAYYTKEDITEYISKSTIIPFVFDKMSRNGFDAPDPTPLITQNADLIGIMDQYVEGITDYKQLKFLYKDVLLPMSVLDPSVGSGAFLFAALRILLPIYQKCVYGLRQMAAKQNDPWLAELLQTLSLHAEEYYLTKQVILNNLYGVDIVEEATEICKLRLFLQLASHLPDIQSIEPLPDIDFNIYAGNSLVGGLSWEDLERNYLELFGSDARAVDRDLLQEQITQLTEQKQAYRQAQQQEDEGTMMSIKTSISLLQREINNSISLTIDNPFHWFADFNEIISNGGFDVIIGNPPYVKLNKVKNYEVRGFHSVACGDLYGLFIERCGQIQNSDSFVGLIVPISLVSTDGFQVVRNQFLKDSFHNWFSSFSMRPSKLFDGVDKHLTIWLCRKQSSIGKGIVFTSKYHRWNSDERDELFESIKYIEISSDLFLNGSIPKINSEEEVSILKKIKKHAPISYAFVKDSEFKVYHTRKLRYYVQFLDTPPKIIDSNGVNRPTSELKIISCKSKEDSGVVLATYLSTLFFWYYITYSDCRNVNKREVYSFPLNIDKLSAKQKSVLFKLNEKLMTNLQDNSSMIQMNYKKYGLLNIQTFKPRLTKPIVDKIDDELGGIYGFTNSEIDRIVSFESKFRTSDSDE